VTNHEFGTHTMAIDSVQRARESLEHHGVIDNVGWGKLSAQLRYVDGDYREGSTYEALRRELGDTKRPLHYLAIPPTS
jgi:glucose-6-phosphate 1-dehydrogenase